MRHISQLVEKRFLQGLAHQDNVLARPIVRVAVGEHRIEVLDAILRAVVIVVLQTLLNRTHIHR